MTEATHKPTNFIKNIIREDLESGKHTTIKTRFPPEPNGYLHIGHAKAICVSYGLAEEFGASYHLRFDDTNPAKEKIEYEEAIKEDIKWLGFDWGEHLYYSSDYFQNFYDYAVKLVQLGKAYVCSLSAEQVREYRGTLKEPGRDSPDRDRPIDESLKLLGEMKAGKHGDGTYTLRAKIDMSSGNINLRDPAIYRIKHVAHHRSKDDWCIYPMYDYAHCISDALEGITHSLCSLEFQDHRPLYNWFLEQLQTPHRPRQIEFSRLNLNYTLMSKRYLKKLIDDQLVDGWDDPRMPTLRGLRRRGFTPASIRNFCTRIGVTKQDSIIDMSWLEESLREDLNESAPRAFAVLDPIELVIENINELEEISKAAPNHPFKPEMGERPLSIGQKLWIERDDFKVTPPNRKYFRLAPGKEVRLRYSYIIKCNRFEEDEQGNITRVFCTADPETLGKNPVDGRKVKGIIHWLNAESAVPARVNVYDRLFTDEVVQKGDDFEKSLNPDSLVRFDRAFVEASLDGATAEDSFQFERLGYFAKDQDSKPGKPVFNKAVGLRDTWAKKKPS